VQALPLPDLHYHFDQMRFALFHLAAVVAMLPYRAHRRRRYLLKGSDQRIQIEAGRSGTVILYPVGE
jgi:hypothetical protein